MHIRSALWPPENDNQDKKGESVNVKLQTDNLHDDPGSVFDQIWNAVQAKVKDYPQTSDLSWTFDNVALNGAIPLTADNKIGGDSNGGLARPLADRERT